MRFEHLIEINDVRDLVSPVLTREQLWRGLVLRAERPELFVPTLSEASVVVRESTRLVRRLRYGDVIVTDEVLFEPLSLVRYEIAAQGEIPRSTLRMSIEEPRPAALFVRFTYEDDGADADEADQELFDAFRRAAYEEADIATIGTIRHWIAEGGHLVPDA